MFCQGHEGSRLGLKMIVFKKTFTFSFSGPPLDVQSVGSALVSLNDNLLLINGPVIHQLGCQIPKRPRSNLECAWSPAARVKHSRKYPIAMLVPKSIINTGTTSISTLFDGILQPPVFIKINEYGK